MKKEYWLALMVTMALVGCGKPEISSDCSLNGSGEYKCNFKNKGNAKGSLCEHIVLQANPGYKRYFGIYFGDSEYRNIMQPLQDATRGVAVYINQAKENQGPSPEEIARDKTLISTDELASKWIKEIMQSVKSSGTSLDQYIIDHRTPLAIQAFEIDAKGLSQTEVCSGIVEAGDVRDINGLVHFGSQGIPPVDACFNPYGDRKWTNACSFTTINVTEIDKLVKAKLESTPAK